MDGEQLELIRTLLNNETHTHKLVQFILSGQLSLVSRLKTPKMKALKSRIVAPCSVNPLNLDEAREMIRLRHELRRLLVERRLDEARDALVRLEALVAADEEEEAAWKPEIARWRASLGYDPAITP